MDERPDLLTALDACRPDSEDLDSPELADWADAVRTDPGIARQYESLQQWDAAVREALQQGDVPEGLEGRLLAAVEEAAVPPMALPAESQSSAPSSSLSRRRWWWGIASAAVISAVAVGTAVWSVVDGSDPLTPSAVHERALAWSDTLVSTDWRTTRPPLRDFPFAAEVRPDPDAWQRISLPDELGHGVAYRLPTGGNVRRMTLFVLKADVAGLDMLPPRSPYKTMDHLVAAWQIGDHVYVLVLQGDDLGALQDVYERSVNTAGNVT